MSVRNLTENSFIAAQKVLNSAGGI